MSMRLYSSVPSLSSAALTAVLTVSLAGLAVVSQTRAAEAQVTRYDSLTYFSAATTSTLYDFEGIAPAQGNVDNPSLIPLTVTTGNGSNYSVYDSESFASLVFYSINGTDSLVGPLSGNSITLGFGSSVTAFATEFGFSRSTFNTSGSVRVQLFNGSTAVGSPFDFAVSGSAFVGLTSTEAFDSAVLTGTTPTPVPGTFQTVPFEVIDNVRVGPAAVPPSTAAPEPGSLALLLPVVGVAGMVIRKWKSSK